MIESFIRDVDELARMPLGVHALGATPRRAVNMTAMQPGCSIDMLGANIEDGAWIYADADCVIVIDRRHTEI